MRSAFPMDRKTGTGSSLPSMATPRIAWVLLTVLPSSPTKVLLEYFAETISPSTSSRKPPFTWSATRVLTLPIGHFFLSLFLKTSVLLTSDESLGCQGLQGEDHRNRVRVMQIHPVDFEDPAIRAAHRGPAP